MPLGKKQLAVILFSDIQGYTALMEENESKAAFMLRRFRTELNEKVALHNGHVVQYYGDGGLCTFQIPVEAVRCAMALQQSFAADPEIPVRIGIHQGVITFEDELVFGHAVNVTSRIESMAVPQAILFSDTVREGLLEERDLQTLSLGSFEYKNVEGSMEVFALANKEFALPRRVDLKGKFKDKQASGEPAQKSIAVLPFENFTSDPAQAFLGDGIAEEIIYALSRLNQMKVISRISSSSFKGKEIGAYEIGKQLNVVNLLTGSVKKQGNRIRVSAELVNVQSGFQLWAEQYDGTLDDYFGIQEQIAQAMVRKLELTLLPGEADKALINRQTANLDAYQLYLKGRQLLDRRTGFEQALQHYREALAFDPQYALAYSAIAYVYFYQVLFDAKPPTFFLKAQEASHQAIQLDSRLAEAYIIEGIVYFYYYWNPKKALEQYKIAFSLNPSFDIHRIMAYYYIMVGSPDEAIRLARRAVELDPLNHGAVMGLGEILYRSAHFEEAIAILESLHANLPANLVVQSLLGASYWHVGEEANTEEFLGNHPFHEGLPLIYSLPKFNYLLEKGRKDEATVLLEMVEQSSPERWISPLAMAMLYFGLDDLDRVEQLVHKALTERDPLLWIIDHEPTWRAFRHHSTVDAILTKRFVHR